MKRFPVLQCSIRLTQYLPKEVGVFDENRLSLLGAPLPERFILKAKVTIIPRRFQNLHDSPMVNVAVV